MKYTRRKFLENACILTAIPVYPMSFLSSPATIPKVESMQMERMASDLDKVKEILKQKSPAIWLFSGDSITAGVEHTHGYRSYPEVFAERVRYELGRSLDPVINTGISGHTTLTIIDHFDWSIRQFNPTVVSLMIGTNDCAKDRKISPGIFKENVNSLVERIRMLGAVPILHTPPAIIENKAPERSAMPDYVDVIKQVAADKQTILVDNWAFWQNAMVESSQSKVFKEWLNDPLHPNGAGHREVARLMFKELSIFNAEDATCGGKYYEGEH